MREHIRHIYCVCMHVPAHTCMHTCVPVVYYIQECRCMRVCYSSARASSIESDILQALGLHPTIINHHHEADFRASRHGAMGQWFSILFQLVDRFDNKSRSTQTALCSLCQTLSVCSLIYSSSDPRRQTWVPSPFAGEQTETQGEEGSLPISASELVLQL